MDNKLFNFSKCKCLFTENELDVSNESGKNFTKWQFINCSKLKYIDNIKNCLKKYNLTFEEDIWYSNSIEICFCSNGIVNVCVKFSEDLGDLVYILRNHIDHGGENLII